MRVHWTTWLYKDCTVRVRSVLQLCYHSATFSYSALLPVAMLPLHRSIPCIYCALAVTQSDIAWHALMLIKVSQSLLSYQHGPPCMHIYSRSPPQYFTFTYYYITFIFYKQTTTSSAATRHYHHHHTVQVTMQAFSICTIALEKDHYHTVQVTVSQPPPHVPVGYLHQLVIEKHHLQWPHGSTRTIRTTTCARK